MLQNLRDKTQSIFAYIIIAVLILSFALWGVSSYFTHGPEDATVAKVNGQKISLDFLNKSYQNYARAQEIQLGAAFSPSAQEQVAIKQQMLNNLISSRALVLYLEKTGFAFSQAAAEQIIFALPAFNQDGKFSPNIYRQYLMNTGMSDAQFINQFSEQQMSLQLPEGLVSTQFSLPFETLQEIELAKQKRKIRYAVIGSSSLSKIPSVTDKEVKAYYQDHLDQYKTPEQIKVDYIELSEPALEKMVKVTESALQAYYQANVGQFIVKGKQQTFDEAKEAVKKAYIAEQATTEYTEMLDKITNISYEQPDSLEPTSKETGLKIKTSDYFSKAGEKTGIASNPNILQAAFSDDVLVGENNSEVIQTASNVAVVLRVSGHKQAANKPLADVAANIKDILKKQAENLELLSIANKIKAGLAGRENIDSIAKKNNIQFKTTGYLDRSSKDLDKAILSTAFSLAYPATKPDVATQSLEDNKYAVIQVLDVKNGQEKGVPESELKGYQQQVVTSTSQLENQLMMLAILQETKIKVNEDVLSDH